MNDLYLKPYIDENNLKDAVGLNYTQNDIDGDIILTLSDGKPWNVVQSGNFRSGRGNVRRLKYLGWL